MSGPSKCVGLQCVERAFKFPMVDLACETAFQTYRNIKASNRFLDFTLSITEKAGSFVVQQSVPVIKKFENQIKAVDDMACRGLNNLETIFPVITLQPEQVLCQTRYRYYETIKNSRNECEILRSHVKNLTNRDMKKVAEHVPKLLSCLSSQFFLSCINILLNEFEIILNNQNHTVQNGGPEQSSELQCGLLLLPSIVKMYNAVKQLEMMVHIAISKNVQKIADVWNSVKQLAFDTYNCIVDMMEPTARLLHVLFTTLVEIIKTLLMIISHPEIAINHVMLHHMWYFGIEAARSVSQSKPLHED